MRLSRQFQVCLFSCGENISRTQKHVTPRSFARVKNCCLCCLMLPYFCFVSWFSFVTCFCARKIFSSKKNKQDWNCPDSLNTQYYWGDPYQPTYQEFICKHLFLFLIICENLFFLWEPFWISSYLWWSVRIYFFKSLSK